LNELFDAILPHNRFYRELLGGVSLPITTWDAFRALPFTFKEGLLSVYEGEWAANLTFPLDHYERFHRTSGTHGRPMNILDTAADWHWWTSCWQYVLDAADIIPADRVALAFSFGPYIGFWSAHDALVARHTLVIPTGGMTSLARLDLIRGTQATALCCTPSYALHLAEVAAANNLDLRGSDVTRIIVAGEPGGSVPAVREQIEAAWNAQVIDHAGASEIGPWGYATADGTGLHVLETEFIAEFLSLETEQPAQEGELAELVLTSLGRIGAPVIRYRTGDVVRPHWTSKGENQFVQLSGGVVGRADDMLIIRGVNIFPSSVEQIVRSFPEVVEFRVVARREGALDTLHVEVEDRLQQPARIAQELHLRLGLQVPVTLVPLGSLPRFEGKGKRFWDERR
jgi:phenylacetate-CoA ligase